MYSQTEVHSEVHFKSFSYDVASVYWFGWLNSPWVWSLYLLFTVGRQYSVFMCADMILGYGLRKNTSKFQACWCGDCDEAPRVTYMKYATHKSRLRAPRLTAWNYSLVTKSHEYQAGRCRSCPPLYSGTCEMCMCNAQMLMQHYIYGN